MSSKMQLVRFATAFEDIQDINPSFAVGKLRIAYVGDNRNGSNISKDVMEAAIPTMYNCPVVAHYDRATNSFGSHDIELVQEDENHYKLVNVTQPVGVVPAGAECFFETDVDENGVPHEYLSTTVLLWKRQEAYEHICEVETIGESMEVVFDKCHVDNRGVLVADAMHFEAFCLLESAEPCYEGAELKVFSAHDELEFKQQYAQMMTELKQYAAGGFSNTAENSQEGGEQMSLNETIIAEILAEFDLTVEDLDFEITEDMTADQLREKASAFAAESADPVVDQPEGEPAAEPVADEPEAESEEAESAEAEPDEEPEAEPAADPEPEAEEPADEEPAEEEQPVEVEAEKKSFSSTYNDKRAAISNALDPIVDGETETYFWLVDFDDSYAFVERDEFNNSTGAFEETHGRFPYSFDEETKTATLTGDFEPMVMAWLTLEEYDALEERRALLEELLAFKKEAMQKTYEAGLNDVLNEFADLQEVEEFVAFAQNVKELAADESTRMELDEVRNHCFCIRGKQTKSFNQKLSDEKVPRVSLPNSKPVDTSDPVGLLFAKFSK